MTPLHVRNLRLHHATASDRVWLRDTLDRECHKFGHRVTLYDDAMALEFE